MILSEAYLEKLCSDVSRTLHLEDINALGRGEYVSFDGVDFFLVSTFTNDQKARLVLNLGEIEQDYKAEIYETIFAMQGMLDGSLDALFDYDQIRSCLMFRVKLPINLNTSAEGLVSVIKSFVMQIQEWRSTWLQNKLLGSDEQEKNQHYSLA
jgi:hypothetical protein